MKSLTPAATRLPRTPIEVFGAVLRGKPGLLRETAGSCAGVRTIQARLRISLVPASMEALRQSKEKAKPKAPRCQGHITGTQEPTETVPSGRSWSDVSNNVNIVALDYHPKDKINIPQSMLK